MRYNIYENGGAVEGVVATSGMAVTNFITLKSDPVDRLEATSKEYTDVISTTIRSGSVVSGFFNTTVMPSLSGHVLCSENSTETSLSLTGVTPGTYTKVTVGTSGRVFSGDYLNTNDIPVLGWLKFNTGKPSTLAGYSITDAVLRVNGEVVGNLTVPNSPLDNNDVGTKTYTDSLPINTKTYAVGDLLETSDPITPTGFLRCNGGDVLKSLYPALYSLIGDQYAPPVGDDDEGLGLLSYGKPWAMQYNINAVLNGALTGYSEESVLPFTVKDGHVIVTKNRVYLFPFEVDDADTFNFYTNTLNNDSTLNVWSLVGTVPVNIKGSACLVIKNHLYLIGGEDSSIPHNTMVVSNINQDGTLGSFVSKTLPVSIKNSEAFYINGKVIVFIGAVSTGELNGLLIGTPSPLGDDVVWEPIVYLPEDNVTTAMFAIDDTIYRVVNKTSPTASIEVQGASVGVNGEISVFTVLTTLLGNDYTKPIVVNNGVYFFNILDPNTGVYSGGFLPYSNGIFGSLVPFTGLTEQTEKVIPFITKNRLYLLGGVETVLSTPTTLNRLTYFNTVGGYNDYTVFYNEGTVAGSGQSLSSVLFRLPDFTPTDAVKPFVYVKH